MTATLMAAGLELRNTNGGSDKFYRLILLPGLAVTCSGRTGTRGQFHLPATKPPLDEIVTLTGSKERRGYLRTVDVTWFPVQQRLLDDIRAKGLMSQGLHLLSGSFNDAVDKAGTRLTSGESTDPQDLRKALLRPPLTLKPVGPVTRNNGEVYRPRELGGHEDVALLRQAVGHRDHVLLMGPPGTGKTALIEAAFGDAEQLVGTADTTEADLLGTFLQDPDSGAFVWVDGPLLRSLKRDVPLFIDEFALIDPRVLSLLYPLMDGRDELRVPSNPALAPLKRGPGWILACAFNPHVPGVSLSDALRDRFALAIEVGTDFALAKDLGVPQDLITVAKNLDQRRISGEIRWSPQLRALLAFKRNDSRYGPGVALSNLVSACPEEDRDVLIEALAAKFADPRALALGGRYGR